MGGPKNKNTLFGPFNGQEHQNYSTARTDIRAMLHDVQGAEGKRSSSYHNVSAKKETLENSKMLFWGAVNYARIFAFREGFWNQTPRKATQERNTTFN